MRAGSYVLACALVAAMADTSGAQRAVTRAEVEAAALARGPRMAEPGLTRKVPLAKWQEAYEKHAGDVKTVLVFEH